MDAVRVVFLGRSPRGGSDEEITIHRTYDPETVQGVEFKKGHTVEISSRLFRSLVSDFPGAFRVEGESVASAPASRGGDVVLFENGIGNFVLALPFIAQLKTPVVMIPEADRRGDQIATISPFPVRRFNGTPDLSGAARVFKLWGSSAKIPPTPAEVVVQPVPVWSGDTHERDLYLRLVPGLEPVPSRINVAPSWDLRVGRDQRLIAFGNGGVGAYRALKKWPVEKWTALARLLCSDKRAQLVGLGLEDQRAPWEDVRKETGESRLWNFAGRTETIAETAGLLKQCAVLVTTDSALMHIASALGVPIVVPWGGTLWEKNRPLGDATRIDPPGGSCPNRPCWFTDAMRACRDARCMEAIDPQAVASAVRRTLGWDR